MRILARCQIINGPRLVSCAVLTALLGMTASLNAQPLANSDVIFAGLDHPFGVAVQPQTNRLFVAEGAAGRVVRITDQEAEPMVIGFPRRPRPTIEGIRDVGPRGLAFLDRSTLAILGTGEGDRGDPLVIVQVPDSSGPPQTIEAAPQLTVANASADERWQLQGVAVVSSAILCAMTSPDGRSGVARFLIENPAELDVATSFGSCELLATTETASNDRFVCLTISPRGELVVGQQIDAERREGRITFYRVTDGTPLLHLVTDLPTITALSYGPRRPGGAAPQLYALHGNRAEDGGGLYRLDAAFLDGQVRIRPAKLASLDRPTAMAWASDGTLYVTILGPEAVDATQPAGKLVRLSPAP